MAGLSEKVSQMQARSETLESQMSEVNQPHLQECVLKHSALDVTCADAPFNANLCCKSCLFAVCTRF